MRYLLFALGVIALLLPLAAAAQEAPAAIFVLNDGGIYALSPDEGAAHTLVEPHPDHDALQALTGDPITVFSASWLSPDGRYLAYRTFVADALDGDEARLRHALYVLDLENGVSLPVRIAGGGADVRIIVDSLAWSPDGVRLYVVGTRSNANAADAWLQIIERDAWDSGRTVRVPQASYAMARSLLPASEGVVIFDRGIQSPRYQFRLYADDGAQLHEFEIDVTVRADVNLYINTPFNPVTIDGDTAFGIVRHIGDELLMLLSFETGVQQPVEPGHMLALVSGGARESSLRVTTSFFSGDTTGLQLRDVDGELLGDIPLVRAFAYGIDGDNVGSTFALSPDGQTLAWLEEGTVRLWNEGRARDTGVSADALAWGPVLHVPIDVGAWFAG